jgi:putative Mg2+ transporter-C (MgtC) family protein
MGELAVTQATDLTHAVVIAERLLFAVVLGGILGFERGRHGKTAGLRTHILVSMGAAVFVLGSLEAGAAMAEVTRVVQGIATGIGFVGAGAILKMSEQGHLEVKGLTTATTVWLTAAVGMAVGAGRFWLPVLATGFGLVVLVLIGHYEARLLAVHGHRPE